MGNMIILFMLSLKLTFIIIISFLLCLLAKCFAEEGIFETFHRMYKFINRR